ncbi:MAG: DUF1080 domain-containing protein [Planctomycetia bacterium]|nr:DUF1080 domain-containing protein [Planctomycetia bacterium]
MRSTLIIIITVFAVFALRSSKSILLADDKSTDAVVGKPASLFDGKTLTGWKITEFGGQGDVTVADGKIVLEMGSNMTGITLAETVKLPQLDYEITLEAMRVDGDDFFCGLTFPVGDKALSFIVGGWGGATVGLSSLDGADASTNETTTYQDFDRNKWYKLRVAVTQKRVQAWIDEKKVVDVEHTGRKLSIRSEVELSRPLGISTWLTKAALRNITIRRLPAAIK